MPLNGSSRVTLWTLPPDGRARWHKFALGLAVETMLCLLVAASVLLFQPVLQLKRPPKPSDKPPHFIPFDFGLPGPASPPTRKPLLSLNQKILPVPPKPGEADKVRDVDFELELAPDAQGQLTRVLSQTDGSGVACYDRNNSRFFTSFYNRKQDDSDWIPQVKPPEMPVDATRYYVRDLADPQWRSVVRDLCGDEMGVSVAFPPTTVAGWKDEIRKAMDWQDHPDEKLISVEIEFDTNAGNMLFRVRNPLWEKNAPK